MILHKERNNIQELIHLQTICSGNLHCQVELLNDVLKNDAFTAMIEEN